MTDSKRITELNQRSVELTDAELSMAQKFSVLLPMNDLPEIVITGDASHSRIASDKANDQSDEVATIPFEPKDSAPSNTKADSQPKQPVAEDDDEQDLLVSVEMPQDELSISKSTSDSGSQESGLEEGEDASGEHEEGSEEGDFRIEELGQHSERVDKIAKSIESQSLESRPCLVALTNATELHDQDAVFNSLLVSIARRNPTMRLIAIQISEPEWAAKSASVGVGHVLSEEYLLEDVVIPTTVENLDYLAYSESRLTAATFRNRFDQMTDELKRHYDMVFVNCGLSASTYAGAAAEMADSVYLMVSLQVCEKESMEKAADSLRQSGARLSGCIVTEYQRDAS